MIKHRVFNCTSLQFSNNCTVYTPLIDRFFNLINWIALHFNFFTNHIHIERFNVIRCQFYNRLNSILVRLYFNNSDIISTIWCFFIFVMYIQVFNFITSKRFATIMFTRNNISTSHVTSRVIIVINNMCSS